MRGREDHAADGVVVAGGLEGGDQLAQLSLALSTEDVVEGVTAFFEKREPQWKGR